MIEVTNAGIPQRWQKKGYEGDMVYNVYLQNALTNIVKTDGTKEDVARLMTNNNKQYDTIARDSDGDI
jgi:hypothetical protein